MSVKIDNLKDAKASIKAICNGRKKALIKLLKAVDEYAGGSFSPDEYEDYERIKDILIKRHSQHENT